MRKVPFSRPVTPDQRSREKWLDYIIGQILTSSHVPTPGVEVLSPFNQIEGNKGWLLTGIVSPTQLTANVNNYDPADIADATVLRLSSDASRNITGIVPPPIDTRGGRVFVIFNVGSFDIVLTNADAASTEANRFALSTDITLWPNEAVTIWYDPTSLRWRAID